MYSAHTHRICLVTALALAQLVSRPSLLSQPPNTPRPNTSGTPRPKDISPEGMERFADAENRWRLTVVDPKAQMDPVPPSVRAARNALLRPMLQDMRESEKGGGLVTEVPGLKSDYGKPDPKAIWVVATFDHFLVIPIDPGFNLFYTEMDFDIDQVVRQPSTSLLAPGMAFDVAKKGGRIKKPDGTIEAWRLWPERYQAQPAHVYLMEIGPLSAGGLYYISAQWDMSSGRAVPDDPTLTWSSRQAIDGRTQSEIIKYFQSIYPTDSAK